MSQNIGKTIRAIIELGMGCVWKPNTQEFRVNFRADSGLSSEERAYYTPDAQDAINTARVMYEGMQAFMKPWTETNSVGAYTYPKFYAPKFGPMSCFFCPSCAAYRNEVLETHQFDDGSVIDCAKCNASIKQTRQYPLGIWTNDPRRQQEVS